MHVVYTCSLCVCLLGIQTYPCDRLDQGHGAAVASPLSGYKIEQRPSSIHLKKKKNQSKMYYCIMI